MEFICYSKCSTCKKAKEYLDKNNIDYIERDIKTNNPTRAELDIIVNKYCVPINKLFNTSGLLYRSMNLKDKLKDMDDNAKLELLSSDGILVKRPLIINSDKILVGFKEKEWDEYFK